jgi:hypothetical protein
MSELGKKQEEFAGLVALLILRAIDMGYTVRLGEAYRAPEQAALDASKGIGISNSLHTKRLAIDLMLFKDGAYLTDSKDYQPLGEWWEGQTPECCWGGRFKKPDGDHFSITYEGVR